MSEHLPIRYAETWAICVDLRPVPEPATVTDFPEHITLVPPFVGVENADVTQIFEGEMLPEPFSVTCVEIDWFGDPSRPTQVAKLCKAETQQLEAMHNTFMAKIQKIGGYVLDTHYTSIGIGYTPHISATESFDPMARLGTKLYIERLAVVKKANLPVGRQYKYIAVRHL